MARVPTFVAAFVATIVATFVPTLMATLALFHRALFGSWLDHREARLPLELPDLRRRGRRDVRPGRGHGHERPRHAPPGVRVRVREALGHELRVPAGEVLRLFSGAVISVHAVIGCVDKCLRVQWNTGSYCAQKVTHET